MIPVEPTVSSTRDFLAHRSGVPAFSGDTAQKADRWDMGQRIRWVGQGPDGAIYLLEDGDGARLLRLAPPK